MADLALERFRRKQRQLDALGDQLDELRQRMDGRITSSYSGMSVKSSTDGRGSLEDRMIYLVDAETAYNAILDDLTALRLEAERELQSIDVDNVREVLRCYYLSGMTAAQTANSMDLKLTHVFRLKAAGLEQLRKE